MNISMVSVYYKGMAHIKIMRILIKLQCTVKRTANVFCSYRLTFKSDNDAQK